MLLQAFSPFSLLIQILSNASASDGAYAPGNANAVLEASSVDCVDVDPLISIRVQLLLATSFIRDGKALDGM